MSIYHDLKKKNAKGQDLFALDCIICGRQMEGTAVKLSERLPICDECEKKRKTVKRGRRKYI